MDLRAELFGDVEIRSHCSGLCPGGCLQSARDELLGDVVCFRWEQRAAEQAVQRMNEFFAQLGRPATFAAAIASINAEWKATEGFFTDLTLCKAKAVGQRAEKLTAELAAAHGLVAPAAPDKQLEPGIGEKVADAIKGLGKVALVGVGLYAGSRMLASRRSP